MPFDEDGREFVKINPPYRLDPLQTIIDFHIPKKKENPSAPPPDTDLPPGHCWGNPWGGIVLTCLCPGILCINPFEFDNVEWYTSVPSVEICPTPDFTGSCCASGVWIMFMGGFNPNDIGSEICTGPDPNFQPPPGATRRPGTNP